MSALVRRVSTALAAVVTVMAVLVASAVPAAALDPGVQDYTPACDGASEAADAFADAGFAADCIKLYDISFGKNDGTFGEDDLLTRSQVASFFVRAISLAGISLEERRSFPDTENMEDTRVRDEIERLAGANILAGFPDGTFRPNDPLTVAQAATVLMRSMQLVQPDTFHDQGTTTANYDMADRTAFLNPAAQDIDGHSYAAGPSDTTARGLLADMMAVVVQQLIDYEHTDSRSPYLWFRSGRYRIGPHMESGKIGTEISPGTYRAPDTQYDCSWARRSGTDFPNSDDDYIGSGFSDWGPEIVTIEASDGGFESMSCMYWTNDLRPLKSPADPISPGTWQVGVEVAPGTYSASAIDDRSGGHGCKWQRLTGFGGSTDDVVAQGFSSDAAQTVTILSSDVGFKSSSGCTAWTPDEP